jgi:NAD-dependent deacetylase
LIIVGTSMQVYPAAGLIEFAPPGIPIFLIDPRPALQSDPQRNLTVLPQSAVAALPKLVAQLTKTKG